MINPGNYNTGSYQPSYDSDIHLRKLALQLAARDSATSTNDVLAAAEKYYAFLKGGVYK